MEQMSKNKWIAAALIVIGVLLVLRSCTSSDPVDLENPSNNVKPKRLSQLWNQVQTTSDVNFTTTRTFTPPNTIKDLETLAKVQKRYEEGLKRRELAQKQPKKKKKDLVAKNKKKKKNVAKRRSTEKSFAKNNQKRSNYLGEYLGGGAIAARPNQNPNEQNNNQEQNEQDLNYWRNLVFSNPSRETTEMLLAAYLQNKIPPAWFYAIVDEMLASTNGILQESSINLLAMTPSSMSFRRLAMATDRNSPTNIKLLARDSMNDVYKDINYLGILIGEVQYSDTLVAYHAARLIRISAEAAVASNTSLGVYSPLVAILSQILQNTDDERLRHFAASAYDYITQNLSGAGAVATRKF
jgi:hypothetical protein